MSLRVFLVKRSDSKNVSRSLAGFRVNQIISKSVSILGISLEMKSFLFLENKALKNYFNLKLVLLGNSKPSSSKYEIAAKR